MEMISVDIRTYDKRRDLAVPGDSAETIAYIASHFIQLAQQSIEARGKFCVALAGGSTPKALYQLLSQEAYRSAVDWNSVWLFWGDERNVPLDHPDSNYKMAMDAGLSQVGLPETQIFPMVMGQDLAASASSYEEQIRSHVPNGQFDLIMLGMGEDGHTASLFPETEALKENTRWVVSQSVPQLETWRMTLTYPCINQAHAICFYVIGSGKAKMLDQVLEEPYSPTLLPSQAVGTESHKALWICDTEAAKTLDP